MLHSVYAACSVCGMTVVYTLFSPPGQQDALPTYFAWLLVSIPCVVGVRSHYYNMGDGARATYHVGERGTPSCQVPSHKGRYYVVLRITHMALQVIVPRGPSTSFGHVFCCLRS